MHETAPSSGQRGRLLKKFGAAPEAALTRMNLAPGLDGGVLKPPA